LLASVAGRSIVTETLLEVAGLSKSFHLVHAVRDVGFTVGRGETFGIVGESGSGKSTTARLVLRLVDPTTGVIRFRGQDLATLSKEALRRERRHMQMIFQDPYGSLNGRMTIEQLITEPMEVHDISDPATRRRRVGQLLAEVGLPEAARHRFPHEFSGGQRQRIAIARALATEPQLIVADEPVSALDVSVQAQVLNLLLDLQQRHGLALLFISHDLRVVEFMCARIAVMYLGNIVEEGPKAAIYAAPRHPYTQALLDSAPGRERKGVLLKGDIPSARSLPPGCVFRSRCPRAFDRCAHEAPQARMVAPSHRVACHLAEE
jgi:oligopeptide/dipeptide ABC transporter ATP-binding protein